VNLAHLHLLINHFPTVGMIIAVGLFAGSLIGGSEDLKRASLVVFFGLGLITIPTYMSGNAAAKKFDAEKYIEQMAELAGETSGEKTGNLFD